MAIQLFSRGWLAALLIAVTLGFCGSVPPFNASHAQVPAAAAPAQEPPPACEAKVLLKCTPNSGDTAWMLASVALVLMMTIPGLGLFYGGMVRKKNVGDTVMTSFAITCLITVLFACITYTLAFTPGSPYIGGLSRVFLQGSLATSPQAWETPIHWPRRSRRPSISASR